MVASMVARIGCIVVTLAVLAGSGCVTRGRLLVEQERVAASEEKHRMVAEQVEGLTSQMEAHQAMLAERDGMIQGLRDELEAANEGKVLAVEEVRAALADARARVMVLEADLEDAQSVAAGDVERLEGEVGALSAQLAEARDEVERLGFEMTAIRNALDEAREKIEGLERTLREREKEIARLEEELEAAGGEGGGFSPPGPPPPDIEPPDGPEGRGGR